MKNDKFEVGDKVVRTAKSGLGYVQGKTYTVKAVKGMTITTEEHETGIDSLMSNYKLATKLERALA